MHEIPIYVAVVKAKRDTRNSPAAAKDMRSEITMAFTIVAGKERQAILSK